MKAVKAILIAGAASLGSWPVFAHHSYALFDLSTRKNVSGTIAKLEWTNPHVFVWLYVKGKQGYELYSFENGSVTMLKRFGWTPNTLAKGEKVTIEYFPLKDGRNGGTFINATHADGHVTTGDPDAPGGSSPGAFDKDKGAQKK